MKRPKLDETIIFDKVNELLQLVHLEGQGTKYPSMLSGGQRQRVALARVLTIEPKYMLLDEPFGALDTKVRKELRRWLRKLHDINGLTTVFVTHDQEEAMEMADKIAILNHGSLVETGSPIELWKDPKTSFVFDFLGNYNTFFGCQFGDQLLLNHVDGKVVKAFSRPHETILEKDPEEKQLFLSARLTMINQAGPLIKTELEDASGVCYQVDLDHATFSDLKLKEGDHAWIKPKLYRIFND